MNAMRWSVAAWLALGSVLLAGAAAAQAYPTRPVRIVVPTSPGGGNDFVARAAGQKLGDRLGQQFIVDNRPGAGGSIGTTLVAKAPPDGYTLLLGFVGQLAMYPHVEKAEYDPRRDFIGVSLLASSYHVLAVHPSLPVKSVQDLLALAKARPGALNYSSAGNGAPNHLAMELFKSMAGVDIQHVPYKGAPQAVADLLAGHMNMGFNSIAPMLPHIRAGRLRVIGVASPKRSPQLPDVPTIAEAGVPGFEAGNWFGLFAPAKTPRPIIARLNEALAQVVRAPEMRAQFEALGAEPVGNSSEEFTAFVRRESQRYAKVVRVSGAKLD